jgi:hypothetical protein
MLGTAVAQSEYRLAMGWKTEESEFETQNGQEKFSFPYRPEWFSGPPSLPRGKAEGA